VTIEKTRVLDWKRCPVAPVPFALGKRLHFHPLKHGMSLSHYWVVLIVGSTSQPPFTLNDDIRGILDLPDWPELLL